MRSCTTRLAGTLALTMACGLAAGEDVLVTTKNRRYEGQVVDSTASKITFKTTLHGFETTLTFARSEVASLELDDVDPAPDAPLVESDPVGEFTADQLRKVGDEKAAPMEVVKRDGVPLYLEVPLEGTFGEAIYPKGIAEALKWAHEHEVTDIVFRIESPGGAVWSAVRIVELMNEYRDGLRYHALIENSISAAIWPTFSCDTIVMAPRSTWGGAVIFRHDANTGEFEVDKKFNSIQMAKLATQAEESGHEGQIARAMMITDQELYAVRESDGTYTLTDSEPADGVIDRDYVLIDGPETILTLTANDAEMYGIARKLHENDLDELRDVLGYSEWDNAGDAGVRLTEQWADKCSGMSQEMQSRQASIMAGWGRYSNEKYIRGAIRALEQIKKDMIGYDRLARKADDYEMAPYAQLISDSWEGDFTREWLDRTIQEYRTKLLYGP